VWAPLDTTDEWGTNVSVCSLDNPADVRPRYHTYADTRLPWFDVPDGLPRFTEQDMQPLIDRWKAEWWS
jgi:hypothetical protein